MTPLIVGGVVIVAVQFGMRCVGAGMPLSYLVSVGLGIASMTVLNIKTGWR